MSIGIYKIENPKGKIYIGKSVNIEQRLSYYKSTKGKNSPLLGESIKKYGFNNHNIKILEECDKKQLNKKEKYWINFYNSYNNGLNSNRGGGGPTFQTHESKYKISQANKGNICPHKGKNLSDIHKKRIGESNRGNKKPDGFGEFIKKIHSKPVLQFSKEGILLARYKSYVEARQTTGIDCQFALNKTAKTAKGYIWIYEKDWDGLPPKLEKNKNLGKPKPWLKGIKSPNKK